MRILIYTSLLISIVSTTLAQQIEIRGTVVNEKTNAPIAFVNVFVKENNTIGTTTDIQGDFSLTIKTPDPRMTLEFSFVGFERKRITITGTTNLGVIMLREELVQLKEITFAPEKNKAIEIIKKVTSNRYRNDPDNYASYKYDAYNKTVVTLNTIEKDTLFSDTVTSGKLFKNAHLFITESYTKVENVKPGKRNEKVLANRMSGFDNPNISLLSNTFQPFSFYSTFITLFEVSYLNPISQGSSSKYDFTLIDELIRETDTTYIIAYEPQPGKNFNSLKGLLYINTNGFALQNVFAQTADPTSITTFTIEQKYGLVGNRWFPVQLSIKFLMHGYKINKRSVLFKNQTFITNPEIDSGSNEKSMSIFDVDFNGNKNKDSIFWTSVRVSPLTRREANTYKRYESLNKGQKKILNGAMDKSLSLVDGRFPIGSIDILVSHLLRYNEYEKIRTGLGIGTNEKLSKLLSVHGYFGYGFGDKAIKYGAGFQITPLKNSLLKLSFRYSKDVQEPGGIPSIKTPSFSRSGDLFRSFLTSRMDSVERYSLEVESRPFRNILAKVSISNEELNPAYEYTFTRSNETFSNFKTSTLGLSVRYVFRENIMKINNMIIPSGISYPIMSISLLKSFQGIYESNLSFFKADFKFEHRIKSRLFGTTDVFLNTGKVWGEAPYSYLYNGKGSKTSENISLFLPAQFQTMGIYEFLSDQYLYFGISHNFGALFATKDGLMKPEVIALGNFAFGSLESAVSHESFDFKTLERGYFESGILLNNILRLKTNLYYLGYGMGSFFRYGPYKLSSTRDNTVFVVSMTITF